MRLETLQRFATISVFAIVVAVTGIESPLAGTSEVALNAGQRAALVAGATKSLESTLSSTRGDYFWPNGLVWKQIRAAVSGPPDSVLQVDEHTLLVSACRQGSCMEKGAMIVQDHTNVRAAAILHYHCHNVEPTSSDDAAIAQGRKKSDCEINRANPLGNNATLTIFVFRPSSSIPTSLEATHESELRNWAKAKWLYAKEETIVVSAP